MAKGEGSFLLHNVPNDDKGREFVAMLRKYMNRERCSGMRIRGNGPRAAVAKALGYNPRAFDQDLPMEHATTFRVYLDVESMQNYYARKETETLRARIHDVATELRTVKSDYAMATIAMQDAIDREVDQMRRAVAAEDEAEILRADLKDAYAALDTVREDYADIPQWIVALVRFVRNVIEQR
jgi:hypothetical protein